MWHGMLLIIYCTVYGIADGMGRIHIGTHLHVALPNMKLG